MFFRNREQMELRMAIDLPGRVRSGMHVESCLRRSPAPNLTELTVEPKETKSMSPTVAFLNRQPPNLN